MFDNAIATLPYTTVLKNEAGETMRAADLLKFVEKNSNKITVEDMNKIISYVASLEIRRARPIMEIVEQKEKQSELWTLVEE